MLDPRDVRLRFGHKLRQYRLARGLSQEAFAALAQVHRTYVGSVERGERNPSLLNICRFARALGLQPADLMPDLPPEGSCAVQE